MRRLIPFAAILAATLPAAVSAQSSSLFGNRGITSQGGFSSTPSLGGPSGAGMGNSGTMSSGSSMSSGGMTGNSTNGLTGNTTGQAGNGSSTSGMPALGAVSGQTVLDASTIGTGAFVGRSDNTGRFVGNARTGQAAMLSAFGQALQGLPGNFGGGNGNRSSQQPDAERFQLRPTLRVGFDYAPVTATATLASPSFEKRFTGITERRPQLAGVDITPAEGGKVVLRGSVASEDSKKLAAALLRLEPGVREVVNEITVAPPAAR